MKHPVLTRFFAMFLAVLCLIMLMSGLKGLKTEALQEEIDAGKLAKLRERIDNYTQLSERLSLSAMSAQEYEELLELIRGEHESVSSQHITDLAMYTATKGGLVSGEEALDEAAYVLDKYIKQYYEGLAAYEEGVKAFEAMKGVLQAVEPRKAEAAAAAGDCAVKAAELEQMILLLSQPVPTPEPSPEITPEPTATPEITPEPTAEPTPAPEGESLALRISPYTGRRLAAGGKHYADASGGGMQIMGYVAKLSQYANLASELAAMLAPIMPEGSVPSGGGFNPGDMQNMPPVQQLTVLKQAFEATGSGLNMLLGAVQQMEAGVPEAEQQLESSRLMLEEVHMQLWDAGLQLGKGRQELEREQEKLSDTETELEKEKEELQLGYQELQELEQKAEEQKQLENKHSSAKILLMTYDGISEGVEAGEELIDAANREAEELEEYYAKQRLLLRTVSVLALAAAGFGLVALLGSFELMKLQGAVRILSLLCLDAAALCYVANYYMCAEHHYIAIFTGLFAVLLVLVSGREKKKRAKAV